MTSFDEATALAEKFFSRAPNYPRETAAFCGLVNGLVNAEKVTKISAARIAAQCAEASKYCPTDADLLTIARDMVRCDAVASGTFDSLAGAGNHVKPVDEAAMRKQYGEPQAFDRTGVDTERLKTAQTRERELLGKIKAKYPKDLNWTQMANAAEEFGYHDYAKAWRRAQVGGTR